jgi:hypothetical protein
VTAAEQTALARECLRLAGSDLTGDEQEQAALILGQEFGLTPTEALTQLAMARLYLEPEMAELLSPDD